jgi:hypothetical protein
VRVLVVLEPVQVVLEPVRGPHAVGRLAVSVWELYAEALPGASVWGHCAGGLPGALRPHAGVAHSLPDVVFRQVLTMYACSDRLTL